MSDAARVDRYIGTIDDTGSAAPASDQLTIFRRVFRLRK
jgi:hypothetical protein